MAAGFARLKCQIFLSSGGGGGILNFTYNILFDGGSMNLMNHEFHYPRIRYSYLHTNNLITKNQSGFRPGDSTTNQLLYLLNEIHQAFDSPKSLEARAVFLDISKAFDKVWHDGLIFKLEQNGISGNLLKLFQNYFSNRK